MVFTPGNIITLCICLVLVILFRQLDKGNRSIEKVKKFGDKLKDDLEAFIKERTAKLEESSISLDVQQAKAVAAVKRLESIREDLEKREADLLARTKAVDDFGKQIATYDSTIRQLSEMTALAQENLSKIRAESDFADSLGKKLMAAEKDLSSISAAIPAMQETFRAENRASLESIQADTLARVSKTVDELGRDVETARQKASAILGETAERMNDLYQKSFAEASRRADTLEDAAFAKLKDQAAERLAKYKEQIEEKTAALHELTKERVQETQQLAKGFKADWQAEADEYLEATRAEIRQLQADYDTALSSVEDRLKSAESLAASRAEEMQGEVHRLESELSVSLADLEKRVGERIESVEGLAESRSDEMKAGVKSLESSLESSLSALEAGVAKRLKEAETSAGSKVSELAAATELASTRANDAVGQFTQNLEERLAAYGKDVDYRLAQFDRLIGDTGRLEGELRVSMKQTEDRVTGDFSLYTQDQQAKQDAFAKKLTDEAAALSTRMQELETGLNELKSRAYDNVSAKLKMFEDDFFADLGKRSDAITAALEHWKTNVDERLETLSAESESGRKDVEDAYAAQLKERLAAISEQYRAQNAKLEEQIASVEAELRSRITASDQSILAFVEQSRQEFAQARETASLHVRNELDAHALSVQEIMRRQEREVDARTKEFVDSIEAAKAESEATLGNIKTDFAAWQTKNEQQLAEASTLFAEKLARFEGASKESMAAVEASWQTNYRDFTAKTAEERKQLKDSLDGLKKDIAQATADFDHRSAESLAGFNEAYATMVAETERRVRETSTEADAAVKALKATAQEIRESVDQAKDRLFQKLQSDTGALGATLEEIDKRQKGFIAQTRIFDRADELKVALETGIENLKNELSRLDVYRGAMDNLEQQYAKIRKLEEETNQKVTRFTTEKKRIDILESDFNKLLGLSDSIDKKVAELTGANDDMQQFQVQIRRFEESVTDVNARYERLEKKAVVLDQTVEGIDQAFEKLKGLEGELAGWKNDIAGLPAELDGVRKDLDALLANKEKTGLLVEKLGALDDILADVEKRTEKMQTAREWLARTETRLDEISKQSQDQLKLLGDLLKEDNPVKKTKGAPPIGIRENVVKLAHQGWKVDEIARALHLSRGEVELILELPQN